MVEQGDERRNTGTTDTEKRRVEIGEIFDFELDDDEEFEDEDEEIQGSTTTGEIDKDDFGVDIEEENESLRNI